MSEQEFMLRRLKDESGVSELKVLFKDSGEVVFDGYESGKRCQEFFGDSDYEYTFTVPASAKNQLLAHLLIDRYAGEAPFLASWLEQHQIPFKKSSF